MLAAITMTIAAVAIGALAVFFGLASGANNGEKGATWGLMALGAMALALALAFVAGGSA